MAPLLPKLRGEIAEFLNEVSLTRLSIFYSPTCVGLRYGQPWEHLVAFLDTSFNRSGSAEASPSLPSTFNRRETRSGIPNRLKVLGRPSLSTGGLSLLMCHN